MGVKAVLIEWRRKQERMRMRASRTDEGRKEGFEMKHSKVPYFISYFTLHTAFSKILLSLPYALSE